MLRVDVITAISLSARGALPRLLPCRRCCRGCCASSCPCCCAPVVPLRILRPSGFSALLRLLHVRELPEAYCKINVS